MDMRHPSPEEAASAFEPAPAGGGYGLAVAPARTATEVDPNDPATWHRTPRNAPCPCGSGKKYKHCHGKG